MKKEVFIAIFLGIIIGLMVTFGIRFAQKAVDKPADSASTSTDTPQVEVTPTPSSQLVISSPDQGTIFETETITIKGNTTPKAFVSFLSDDYQTSAAADEVGNFTVEFELISGPNTIYIASHQPDGSKVEQLLEVVYSTADLESSQPTPTVTGTEEEDE